MAKVRTKKRRKPVKARRHPNPRVGDEITFVSFAPIFACVLDRDGKCLTVVSPTTGETYTIYDDYKIRRRCAYRVFAGEKRRADGYQAFATVPLHGKRQHGGTVYIGGCRVWASFKDAIRHFTGDYCHGQAVAIESVIILAKLHSQVVKAGFRP